ncbi:transcriptional regulator [Pseudoalteromonas maricaloris]|uniref:transcriptional regulator n=1 Tax=Pseudoalteromonas maricaloris TaxID=184924 RepID=UPI00057E1369|nr:Cro/CI family transcriptional regulator [Pseudoalteromonas flavipulchra]KID38060.1 hypothetical protein QT15_04650 [Pseudoalteromonas flavipulchra NCIMB 2033 = ATCC BAA-314]MBD0782771.1 helix-turn-helix domain-containing protein [Pseudoalteromonas flavipulchra]MBE0372360.1 hypothetical protein [Pseudoalteromonas flavipulchra NCIMB 2033 = ATCC BAA-314]
MENKPLNALKRAIKIAGGQQKLAEKLGNISQQTVSGWMKKGVPPHRAVEIEKATDVSRTEIRPDIFLIKD